MGGRLLKEQAPGGLLGACVKAEPCAPMARNRHLEGASNALFNSLVEKTTAEHVMDDSGAQLFGNFAGRSLEQNSICNESQHSSGARHAEN